MIKRKPHLAQYAGGVPGGPANPLGARALYLYRDGKDTRFRLHGTNEPWSIGQADSNGCIRLLNDDIIDLYDWRQLEVR
jgi:lipoprotein-anchoring transpeptidase ErfK/SrfK